MQGFLSRDGVPPAELLAKGRDEVACYGGHIVDRTVDLRPDSRRRRSRDSTSRLRTVAA